MTGGPDERREGTFRFGHFMTICRGSRLRFLFSILKHSILKLSPYTFSFLPTTMDSFAEPYTRRGDDISIAQVRENIATLEEQHKKQGIPLSGRILHVCHYLPITATLQPKGLGVLSPPATPPSKPSDVPTEDPTDTTSTSSTAEGVSDEKEQSTWSLAPRHGHAAMISGIRSLAHTHEQLIIGWTGDIVSATGDKVSADSISAKERDEFDAALKAYHPKESDPDDERDRKTKYVPVWLDDKVAHGHYDGYCKQSTYHLFSFRSLTENGTSSSLATVPLPPLARRCYRIRFGRLPLSFLRIRKCSICQAHRRNLSAGRSHLGP